MSSIDNDITANIGEGQGNENNTGDVQSIVTDVVAGDPSSSAKELPNDANVSEEMTDVTGIVVYVTIYPCFSGLFVKNSTTSTDNSLI